MFKGNIDALDINCGCPQGFALQSGIGSACLRDADKLVGMMAEIVESVDMPVSVKLRLHDDVPTTISIIERLIDVGVVAFTVHGRYYWQKGEKRGLCDWEAIRAIRDRFPDVYIMGNGDVGKFEDFDGWCEQYGVNSVMSGYGALKDPTIFSEGDFELGEVISSYVNIARGCENDFIDILRHVAWMTKSYCNGDKAMRGKLFNCVDLEGLYEYLSNELDLSVDFGVEPLDSDKIKYRYKGMKKKQKKKHEENVVKQT